MAHVPLPDLAFLRECFELNTDGILVWRHRPRAHFSRDSDWRRWCTKHAGTVAGSEYGSDYRKLTLNGRSFPAHRITYYIAHGVDPGEHEVDHRDGDRRNNRVGNLRLATRSENACNGAVLARNTSGIKGVRWDAKRSRWNVSVVRHGIRHFRSFREKLAAIEWMQKKRAELHKEFARQA